MQEPPPVSLVLLAYRQEAYVDAAVRSALAQDYDDLEIVLSDDCSPDGTFAIMERLAADYRGPHRIVLNRTAGNAGLLPHFYHAAARASGELVVVAAGDDISHPDRVRRLAEAWRREGADAVYSRHDVIDGQGGVIEADAPLAPGDYHPRRYFPGGEVHQIAGATAAYSRRVFDLIDCPDVPGIPEDYYLALMLALAGRRVAFVDRPLIQYRAHGGALTHAREEEVGLEEIERLSAKSSASVVPVLLLVEKAALTGAGIRPPWRASAAIDLGRLREDIGFHAFRGRWLESSFAERLRMILRLRAADRVRWLAPRLFGLTGLKMIKKARRLIRRS
jgi:glycosyltransferase involved in cell wall biosynthesis